MQSSVDGNTCQVSRVGVSGLTVHQPHLVTISAWEPPLPHPRFLCAQCGCKPIRAILTQRLVQGRAEDLYGDNHML